jgi:hypothetical protein
MKNTERNEIEAMNVIINIQQMQRIMYGKSFLYNDFNANTIEELRTLQDSLIIVYNNTLNPIK